MVHVVVNIKTSFNLRSITRKHVRLPWGSFRLVCRPSQGPVVIQIWSLPESPGFVLLSKFFSQKTFKVSKISLKCNGKKSTVVWTRSRAKSFILQHKSTESKSQSYSAEQLNFLIYAQLFISICYGSGQPRDIRFFLFSGVFGQFCWLHTIFVYLIAHFERISQQQVP